MVTAQDVVEDAWDKSPPAVVIYIIDPFSFATESPEMNRIASLGLLKCKIQEKRFKMEPFQCMIANFNFCSIFSYCPTSSPT